MTKILILFSLLLLAVSCGNKAKSVKYGQTTTSDLIVLKGEPLKEEDLSIPQSKMLIYENDEKYQVEKDIVVNSFRNPKQDERMLLYWKHKYPDCSFEIQKVNQAKTHQKGEEELRCSSAGLSVIYDPNIQQVIRVVEYEK